MSRLTYTNTSGDNQHRATTLDPPRPSAAEGARYVVERLFVSTHRRL